MLFCPSFSVTLRRPIFFHWQRLVNLVSELQEVNDLEKHRKRLKNSSTSVIKAAGEPHESSGSRKVPQMEQQETSVMEQDLSDCTGNARHAEPAEAQNAIDEARAEAPCNPPAGDSEMIGRSSLGSTLVAMEGSADEGKEQECPAELPTKQRSDKRLDVSMQEAPATMDAQGMEVHGKMKSASLERSPGPPDEETGKERAPQKDEGALSEIKALPALPTSDAQSECTVEVSTCNKMELEKPHTDGSGNITMPIEGKSESSEKECEKTVGKMLGDCETAEAHGNNATTMDAQLPHLEDYTEQECK